MTALLKCPRRKLRENRELLQKLDHFNTHPELDKCLCPMDRPLAHNALRITIVSCNSLCFPPL